MQPKRHKVFAATAAAGRGWAGGGAVAAGPALFLAIYTTDVCQPQPNLSAAVNQAA